MCIKGENV